jgi:3-hydroxybutyrate dehydrogenase
VDIDMTRPLDGKCALITGSVRGLGLAVAERLAAAGCHIVLNGFDAAEEVETIRARFARDHGVTAIYHGADLRHPDQIESMVLDAVVACGSVDIVINNAVVRHEAPVEAFDVGRWDDGIAVNLSAAFHTIRLAVPHMKRRGWGRILNVSSIYGLRGAANRVNYVTSKTALIGLTRAIAMETVSHGITCNAVCPGTTETPVHDATVRAMMATDDVPRDVAERRFLSTKQPSGRFIPAEHVAAIIAFLCGPEGANITGAVLPVDGGWSAS